MLVIEIRRRHCIIVQHFLHNYAFQHFKCLLYIHNENTLGFIIKHFDFYLSPGREFKVKLRLESQFPTHYSLKKIHINICCILPAECKGIKSVITPLYQPFHFFIPREGSFEKCAQYLCIAGLRGKGYAQGGQDIKILGLLKQY